MLVLPVRDENTPRGLARATIALALLNILIFFCFQLGDEVAFEKAMRHYVASPLAQMELPRYADYLERKGKTAEAGQARHCFCNEAATLRTAMAALSDGPWQRALARGDVIAPGAPEHARWQKERTDFEALLGRSMTWRWGAVPADFRPVTAFTNTFLHGGFEHLLGNMIFLVLVGLLVEPVLGSLRFLLFYGISGVAGTGLFIAAYPDLHQPLIGASGAIAGVMGMYALVYGLRRIRVFYWAMIYFGYRTMPALLLFPFWVLKEVVERYLNPDSPVAYEAHVGGLLAGALLAGFYQWRHREEIVQKHDAAQQDRERAAVLARARDKVRRLDFEGALAIYAPLLEAGPADLPLHLEAWRCARFVPGAVRDRVARVILSAAPSADLPVSAQQLCLEDCLKATPGRLPVDAATVLRLAMRLAKADFSETAEKLLRALRSRPQLEGSDIAWAQLTLAWRRQRDGARAAACEQYLRQSYPESPALRLLSTARAAAPQA